MKEQPDLKSIADGYLHTLVHESDTSLLTLLGENAAIEDPRKGRISGDNAILQFAHDTKTWLEYRKPRVQHLRTTATEHRVCCESMLHMQSQGESLSLPVGTVVSVNPDNGAAEVHVYYTLWPFNRHHSVRPALFPADSAPEAEHSGIILKYFQGLIEGDLDKVLKCFEADIYFREASGPPYVHWGHAPIAEYFKGLFGHGAPMLKDETITDDGQCVVMEFTVFGWNGVTRKPENYEAGLAVYERSRGGLMSAIRIYDDVDFA